MKVGDDVVLLVLLVLVLAMLVVSVSRELISLHTR
jgi:hypothetical protein